MVVGLVFRRCLYVENVFIHLPMRYEGVTVSSKLNFIQQNASQNSKRQIARKPNLNGNSVSCSVCVCGWVCVFNVFTLLCGVCDYGCNSIGNRQQQRIIPHAEQVEEWRKGGKTPSER